MTPLSGAFRHRVAVLAIPALLSTLEAAPGDYELITETVEAIVSKGLDGGSEKSVLGRVLDVTARELREDDVELAALLRPHAGEVSIAEFTRAIRALSRQSRRPERFWIERTMRTYLRSIDPHSDFFPPGEFRLFKEGKQREFAGVGMELERESDGGFVCMPFPGMAAEREGVKWGVNLLEVNGRPVRDRSLISVASDIRGAVGSPVRLTVTRKGLFKRKEVIEIVRERIEAPVVLLRQSIAGSVIQILTFNKDTAPSVAKLLRTHKAGRTLTLDLRGCPGGSLQAAVATAELFLPPGKRIVSLRGSSGTSHVNSVLKATDAASPLVILQDSRSASSAEVLIAALTENGRALSVGGTTRGKGSVQEVVPLREGYGMMITTSRMLDPKGNAWHLRGLSPVKRLSQLELKSKNTEQHTKRVRRP